ncbi:MAG: hypothetical protein R2823_00725 [Acidimicrobiia bacterium]
MSVLCSAVHMAIDTMGPSAVTGPLASHAGRCGDCSAEIASVVVIGHGLAGLPRDAHRAPERLTDAVMDSLGPVAVPDLESRLSLRVPVAAAVVATAAAGTAVIIHLRRIRAA